MYVLCKVWVDDVVEIWSSLDSIGRPRESTTREMPIPSNRMKKADDDDVLHKR